MLNFFKNLFAERILSASYAPCRHLKDRHHPPFRAVRVSAPHLRHAERRQHLPAAHGLSAGQVGIRLIYLDDIIIANPSMEKHQWDVEEVFPCLQAAGKCTLVVPEMDFLGHPVSASGFAPLPSRVAAIRKYLRPSTVKQLLAFLGVFNFYRRFVPAALRILRPLTNSTWGSPKVTAEVELLKRTWRLLTPRFRSCRFAGTPTARPGAGVDNRRFR